MKKQVLLTGASGFIGYHTAKALQNCDYCVFAPVREDAFDNKNVSELRSFGINIIKGKFYDQSVLDQIFENHIDFVVHLAAIRGETKDNSNLYTKVNVDGTKRLAEYSKTHGVSGFIYCSSVGVLGTIPYNQPAGQDHPVNPDNRYHKSKWGAEQVVAAAHSNLFKTLILRPTITYGAGDNGFIPKLISLVSKSHFVNSTRSVCVHLLNVSSFANLVVSVLQNDYFNGESYILADKNPVSLSDLVNKIFNIKNGSDYPAYLKLPPSVFKFVVNISKLFGLSGFETSIRLISEDWTYDIVKTVEDLGYNPTETITEIEPVLKGYLQ